MLEIRKRTGKLESSCSKIGKQSVTSSHRNLDDPLERVPSDSHHFKNINLDLLSMPLGETRERHRILSHGADFSFSASNERLRSVDNCRASLCSCSAASRISSLASASSTSPRSISVHFVIRRSSDLGVLSDHSPLTS